jgi:hypothetical protein
MPYACQTTHGNSLMPPKKPITPDGRSRRRIRNVLQRNRTVAVPKRFERADLRALFFHHPRHRRHANERGNEEKEHRKHLGNASTIAESFSKQVYPMFADGRAHSSRALLSPQAVPCIVNLGLAVCQFCSASANC